MFVLTVVTYLEKRDFTCRIPSYATHQIRMNTTGSMKPKSDFFCCIGNMAKSYLAV